MKSLKAKLRKPNLNAGQLANSMTVCKDAWTKLDQRVWHCTAVNQPVKLAAKLCKHGDVDVNKLCPSVGYSVVHYAAAKGMDDCLNVLLAHKADVSTKDVTGASPLHASARYGHKGTTAKLLASCSVDVNVRDYNLCTALHFASFEGHLDCVILITNEKNVDIHIADKEGRTALMVASAMGRYTVCQELIKCGSDINHRDCSNMHHTALTLASEAGHADIVRLLCENGANYAYKLADGRTAIDVARCRSRRGVIDVLHIIQLTEAAKKNDNKATDLNPNRKTSVTSKEEDGGMFVGSSALVSTIPLSKIGDQALSLLKESNIEQAKHASDERNQVAALSFYHDSKGNNFYDRDISMYDSKSTLASLSSLDVPSTNESQKNHTVESSFGERDIKQFVKLNEELSRKDQRIFVLESKLKEMNGLIVRLDGLQNSSLKYNSSLQESERTNESLSEKFLITNPANEEASIKISHLQREIEILSSYKDSFYEVQNQLTHSDENHGFLNNEIVRLTEKIDEMQKLLKLEQEKCNFQQNCLKKLVKVIGKETNLEDYDAIFDILKCELLQAAEKENARKMECEENKSKLDELQSTNLEQTELIKMLKSQLQNAEIAAKLTTAEIQQLYMTLKGVKDELAMVQSSNSQYESTVTHLQNEILCLQQHLMIQKKNDSDVKATENKLETALFRIKGYDDDKENWKVKEAELQERLDVITSQYHEVKHVLAKVEKVVSELHVERNQKEAKIAKLEKELHTYEYRKKELEVENNRNRQQLTEIKQQCCKLEDKVNCYQKCTKDFSIWLSSSNIDTCASFEQKKLDSVKKQLQILCELLKDSEKKYLETIAIYRGHLLKAVKGNLNPEVFTKMRDILRSIEDSEPMITL